MTTSIYQQRSCMNLFRIFIMKHGQSFTKIVVFHAILTVIVGILSKAPGLYIDRETFGYSPIIPGGYNVVLTWRYTLPGIVSSGVTPFHFEINTNNLVLSYHAELVSPTVSGAIINLSPFNDIDYIVFTIIIVTEDLPSLQLIPFVDGAPNFSTGTSPDLKDINIVTSSKFYFDGTLTFSPRCFWQWMSVQYPPTSQVKLNLQCAQVALSSDIEITFICDANTYVGGVKVFVILTSSKEIRPHVAEFQSGIYFTGGASNWVYNYGEDKSIFGSLQTQYNCILGLSQLYFILNVGLGAISIIPAYTSEDISSYLTSHIASISTRIICLAQCPSDSFIGSITWLCEPCSDYISNCISCSNETICQRCSATYFLSFLQKQCFLCSDYMSDCIECDNGSTCLSCASGHPIEGGCSSVVGCISVSGPLGICSDCDPTEFYLDLTTNTCQCLTGTFLIGEHCTNVAGCVSTQKVGTTVECTFCNIGNHFELNPATRTCGCISGYQLQNSQCVEKCGDGQMIYLLCDDGNSQDGDGCSSTCEVQTYYRCYHSGENPSQCQYIGDFSIALVKTQKQAGEDRGIFTFQIVPPLPGLSKMELVNYFSFECLQTNHTVMSWSYTSGYIELQVDYLTDLEQSQVNLNFTFDPTYIDHPPIYLSFEVKSDDEMLVISTKTPTTTALKYTLVTLSLITLALVLVGSCFHQTAGVQCMSALQTIYFLHFTAENYSSVLSNFQQMSPVGLSDLFLQKHSLNVKLYSYYQRAEFSIVKAEWTLIEISTTLFLIVIFGVLVRLYVRFGSQLAENFKDLSQSIYFKWLVPVGLGILTPFWLILLNFSLRLNSSQSENLPPALISLFLLFSALIISTILAGTFILNSTSKKDFSSDPKYCYYPALSLFLCFQILCITLWVSFGVTSVIFPLFIGQLTFLIWILWNKPYPLYLDTVGVIFSLTLDILFQVFLLLRKYEVLKSTFQVDVFCCMVIGGVIVVCVILAVVRVMRAALRKNSPIKREGQDNQVEKLSDEIRKEYKAQISQLADHLKRKNIQASERHFLSYISGVADKNRRLIEVNEGQGKDLELQKLAKKKREEFRRRKKKELFKQAHIKEQTKE